MKFAVILQLLFHQEALKAAFELEPIDKYDMVIFPIE